MHKVLLSTVLFCVISRGADVYTFDLLPASGQISGAPGSTTGWGYSITNHSSSLWLATSALTSDPFSHATPSLLFDFPQLAPGATVALPFNAAGGAGLMSVTLDSNTPTGFSNVGNFILSAGWWNGDPLGGGSFLSDAPDATRAYIVTAMGSAPVPEPSTVALILCGALVSRVCYRKRCVSANRERALSRCRFVLL